MEKLLTREVLSEKWINPSYINEYGTMYWRNEDGKIHSIGDKPAVIWSSGNKFWYKNGKYHRDGDKPAVIWSNGDKSWYKNGKCHRDGGKPAVIWSTGKNE